MESSEALDPEFRALAADEIERFRREMVARSGNQTDGQNLSDQELLLYPRGRSLPLRSRLPQHA